MTLDQPPRSANSKKEGQQNTRAPNIILFGKDKDHSRVVMAISKEGEKSMIKSCK